MSNSALATYVNRVGGGNYRSSFIDSIVVNYGGFAEDIYALAEMMASGSAGYHYGIAGSGTIGLFVDEMFSCGIDNAVQILVMDYHAPIDNWNPGDTSTSLANLIEDICRRNYILKLQDGVNFFQDAGGYDADVNDINERLSHAKFSSGSEMLKAQSTIAVGAIKPFMAIIAPEAQPDEFDCYALRDIGCIGFLMYAGNLYDEHHNELRPFKNPNLKAQMERNVIPSRSHWALLSTFRGRDLVEVKKELYWLFFVVAKYGPKLGLWIQPENAEGFRAGYAEGCKGSG